MLLVASDEIEVEVYVNLWLFNVRFVFPDGTVSALRDYGARLPSLKTVADLRAAGYQPLARINRPRPENYPLTHEVQDVVKRE